MKKTLIIIFSTLFISSFTLSQGFFVRGGAQYSYFYSKLEWKNDDGSKDKTSLAAAAPVGFFQLGYNFESNGSAQFSVSSYPGIGFYASTLYGSYLIAQAPVYGELAFGDPESFGGFIGAGFDLSYFTGGDLRLNYGPAADFGISFKIFGRQSNIRLAYTYGLQRFPKIEGLKMTSESHHVFKFGYIVNIYGGDTGGRSSGGNRSRRRR